MNANVIPQLTDEEVGQYFSEASDSVRRRAPKILHEKGAYLNKVFNFMMNDTYMQPHLHPGDEKIEKMHLISGSFALVVFDDEGQVIDTIVLEKGGRERIDVPAFSWHTYVMLTDEVIVYETMEGIYQPDTWKKMAPWAPQENTPEAVEYLASLKAKVKR